MRLNCCAKPKAKCLWLKYYQISRNTIFIAWYRGNIKLHWTSCSFCVDKHWIPTNVWAKQWPAVNERNRRKTAARKKLDKLLHSQYGSIVTATGCCNQSPQPVATTIATLRYINQRRSVTTKQQRNVHGDLEWLVSD